MDVQVAKVVCNQIRGMDWQDITEESDWRAAPKLKSLPPTSEAFEQNVRRAHFQVSVWKAALEKYLPELAPTNFV